MKRYQQLIELIEKLEAEDKRLDMAREDNLTALSKAKGSRVEILEKYDNELLDAQALNWKQITKHKKALQYFEEDELVAEFFDGNLMFRKEHYYDQKKGSNSLIFVNFSSLAQWITLLMEEVQ